MKYKVTIEIELSEDLLGLNDYMKEHPKCPDKLSALNYMLSEDYFSLFDIYVGDFDGTVIKSLEEIE